jgi:hypothetical protein
LGRDRCGGEAFDAGRRQRFAADLGRQSAERILPEFQHLAVGDVIPLSPDGRQGQWVNAFAPNCWMLWGDAPACATCLKAAGDSTWCWGLHPVDERHTRLITRVRMRYRWTSRLALFNPLVEFTDIVMMRKCLLGIKRRTEASTSDAGVDPVVAQTHA